MLRPIFDRPSMLFWLILFGVSACGGGGGSRNSAKSGSAPTLVLQSPKETEGHDERTLVFKAELSEPLEKEASVLYETRSRTASAGDDYEAQSGKLCFEPGQTEAEITILIFGDQTFEEDETFQIELSQPTRITLPQTLWVATLVNDDVELQIKSERLNELTLQWNAVPQAESYRVWVDAVGDSNWVPVGADLPAAVTSVTEPTGSLYELGVRQYAVEAEGEGGITRSAPVPINSDVAKVTHLKASSPQHMDYFGSVVAISRDGRTVAVASSNDSNANGIDGDEAGQTAENSGAVYVFVRTEQGWHQEAFLKASNSHEDAYFGLSLSLSADGNILAAGAYQESSNVDRSGAVYLFTRSGTTWSEQLLLKASDPEQEAYFGSSVALTADGNRLVVGAREKSVGAVRAGAVYVYDRKDEPWIIGERWKEVAFLNADAPLTGQNFGWRTTISSDGKVVAVSAPRANDRRGMVYVFHEISGFWLQQPPLKPAHLDPLDFFGSSLALSGDGNKLAVGVPDEDSGLPNDSSDDSLEASGAVYIYELHDLRWVEALYLKAPAVDLADRFGHSVAFDEKGQTLAVGAFRDDSFAIGVGGDDQNNNLSFSGAAHWFRFVNQQWQRRLFIKATNPEYNDVFGGSVALSADGRSLVVGAIGEDSAVGGVDGDPGDNDQWDSGAAYIY